MKKIMKRMSAFNLALVIMLLSATPVFAGTINGLEYTGSSYNGVTDDALVLRESGRNSTKIATIPDGSQQKRVNSGKYANYQYF